MALTRAQIEQIAQKLRKMPQAPPAEVNVTKQEAVRLLEREIAGLQRKGYSLEQIVESLRGEGLDLTTPTLKSYRSRAKAGHERGRRPPSPVRAAEQPMAASLTPKAAAASTKVETPTKNGKDAFLVKDKDSY
jgi:hypothetical protein